MKKASPFIHGTLVLTAANLFSRFIGFYNRIFLAGLIGAHQMGIYQMIFPIYLVGFSLCFQGFQTALSNMTASLRAKGLEGDAKKILSVTVCFTVMLSILFAAVIFIFGGVYLVTASRSRAEMEKHKSHGINRKSTNQ